MASKDPGGDFDFENDAAGIRKQNRQEQKRQDHKARKAGKAERAQRGVPAQYGWGSSASAGPVPMRQVPDDRGTG